MIKEIWKDVKGYGGSYRVSNMGNVYSLKTNKLMSLKSVSKVGYITVSLFKNNKRKTNYVHRMVAEAFIENPNSLEQVNHIDENKKNNIVTNLEWITHKDNQNHGTKNERASITKGYPIYMMDLEGNILKEFHSMGEAYRNTGIKAGTISGCIKGKGKTAGGYKWALKKD